MRTSSISYFIFVSFIERIVNEEVVTNGIDIVHYCSDSICRIPDIVELPFATVDSPRVSSHLSFRHKYIRIVVPVQLF